MANAFIFSLSGNPSSKIIGIIRAEFLDGANDVSFITGIGNVGFIPQLDAVAYLSVLQSVRRYKAPGNSSWLNKPSHGAAAHEVLLPEYQSEPDRV